MDEHWKKRFRLEIDARSTIIKNILDDRAIEELNRLATKANDLTVPFERDNQVTMTPVGVILDRYEIHEAIAEAMFQHMKQK